MPNPLRVYLVGSHSGGKTTLARWIAAEYSLPMITEVVRTILGEWETTLAAIRVDLDLAAKFQAEIFRRQAIAEDEAGSRFVSDRAFDNLAYAAQHTLSLATLMKKAASYVHRLQEPAACILFVRPHQSLLKDDGVRASLSWEGVMQIDGMIRMLLEMFNLDYVSIDTANMAERARIVRAVIGRKLA